MELGRVRNKIEEVRKVVANALNFPDPDQHLREFAHKQMLDAALEARSMSREDLRVHLRMTGEHIMSDFVQPHDAATRKFLLRK